MDVRLGVLNHTVLQYKTKERNTDKRSRNIEAEEFEDLVWSCMDRFVQINIHMLTLIKIEGGIRSSGGDFINELGYPRIII